MGYRNLQEFIARLEKAGELVRIKEPVSPYLDITEITDRVSKAGGPALLFEAVPGYEMPVLMNAFGSMRRMCLALEVESLDDIATDLLSFMEAEANTLMKKLKLIPKLARLGRMFPKEVSQGPVPGGHPQGRGHGPDQDTGLDLLARGRRSLYHPAGGLYPPPGDGAAQRGHVPPPGL